jgi:hypothetical protein
MTSLYDCNDHLSRYDATRQFIMLVSARRLHAPHSIALMLWAQRQVEAKTRIIDEYCKVMLAPYPLHPPPPPPPLTPLRPPRPLSFPVDFGFDFLQNRYDGVAAFPVLREFLSPCSCGTATQDTDKAG